MAPKKSSIVLNVEQFIRDVEERPAIWNRNYHCNKAFLEQMWEELSAAHKLPKVVLKAKWKGLRDNFRVEYKRIPRAEGGDFLVEPSAFESKWIHYYALLFLTEHMRHRLPKNEHDASFYFPQQSQECEKTIVEPDLTNGLIRIPDSDEEFDEDDVDDADDADDDDEDEDSGILQTPPAAHSQPRLTFVKSEETRSLLRPLRATGAEKQAEDLSTKSTNSSKAPTTAAAPSLCCPPTTLMTTTAVAPTTTLSPTVAIPAPVVVAPPVAPSAAALTSALTPASASLSLSLSLATVGGGAANGSGPISAITQQQQLPKRSVSPPPLYNKAHHVASSGLTAAALSKERDEFPPLNGGGGGGSLHGSHEHLNFTKNSYANGLIPALKLKRPRLSEDSNFNGSSTMDNAPSPLVPEDDDYHYLLSLHPYMKQLNAAQKLRIRTKIQKLIFKELYKEDLEETK